MNGSRSRKSRGDGRRRLSARQLRGSLALLAVSAVLALGACVPGAATIPSDSSDQTAVPGATESALPPGTTTVTATEQPSFDPGLDFTIDADWPAITPENADEVGLLYTHAPVGLIEVLGSAHWDRMALITGEHAALLGMQDLAPSSVINVGDFGDLTTAAMSDRTLALAFQEGVVRLYDVADGEQMHEMDADVNLLAISPDDALLAGCGQDFMLSIWDIESGDLLMEIELESMPAGLSFSPDGDTLAVETEGGIFEGLELWDVASGDRMRQLEWADRAGPIYFIRIAPDWAASLWVSRATALLMEMQSGNPMVMLPHEDFVDEAEFSPDGSMVATSSVAEVDGEMNGVVDLWDGDSGEKLATLVNGEAAVLVEFSPDGTLLASATYDGVIRLWDVASSALLAELGGEQSPIFRLFFAAEGRMLVSASWEGTIRFWAVNQGQGE
jgi:hypothetical protein